MRALLLAIAATWLGACATAVPHLTAGQREWAAARWPETTPAQLEHGRALYLSRCSACHQAPAPGFDTRVLRGEMSQRARLSGADQQLVLRFLEAVRAVGPVAQSQP